MKNFSLEELKMIKRALMTEMIHREDKKLLNRIGQYEDLYNKVVNLIEEIKEEV